MFVEASEWKEKTIRFFLILLCDTLRIECNGAHIRENTQETFLFPAGKIQIKAYQKGNFATPVFDQCAFLPEGWNGIFIVGEQGVFAFPEETVRVLPEKGHFRIINVFDKTLCVRRIGGQEVFSSIEPGTVSPYRLAGAGRYRLQFYCQNEKLGEKELEIKEGERGTLIVKGRESVYIEEFRL